MRKKDITIHHLAIAAIKRSTMLPYDFKYTQLYESDCATLKIPIPLEEDELVICSTVIDKENYSILTTRRMTTSEDENVRIEYLMNATDKGYGDFKGSKGDVISKGMIEIENAEDLGYFIETGRASMIMIQGLRALLRTQHASK